MLNGYMLGLLVTCSCGTMILSIKPQLSIAVVSTNLS